MKRKNSLKPCAILLNVQTRHGLPYMIAITRHPKMMSLIGTLRNEFKSNYDVYCDYLESVGLLSDW